MIDNIRPRIKNQFASSLSIQPPCDLSQLMLRNILKETVQRECSDVLSCSVIITTVPFRHIRAHSIVRGENPSLRSCWDVGTVHIITMDAIVRKSVLHDYTSIPLQEHRAGAVKPRLYVDLSEGIPDSSDIRTFIHLSQDNLANLTSHLFVVSIAFKFVNIDNNVSE